RTRRGERRARRDRVGLGSDRRLPRGRPRLRARAPDRAERGPAHRRARDRAGARGADRHRALGRTRIGLVVMPIPFSLPLIDQDVIDEVNDCLTYTGWLTTGPKVRLLEAEIGKLTGTPVLCV